MAVDADIESNVEPISWSHHIRQIWIRSSLVRGPLWIGLLLVFVGFFFWSRRDELRDIPSIIRESNPTWLVVLLLISVCVYILFAAIQRNLLGLLGRRVPLLSAIAMYIERQTVATVVPAGSAVSSVVLMNRRFKQFGVTANDSVYSYMLFGVIGHASFALMLVPVVGWLLAEGRVGLPVLIGTIGLVFLFAVTVWLIVVAARGRRLPFGLHERLPVAVTDFLNSIQERSLTLRQFVPAMSMAFGVDVLGVCATYAAIRAVHSDATIGMAAAVYTVGTLFALITPLFSGLGVVELSMTVMLTNFGVPAPAAVGATLLYRIGEIWLPVSLGVFSQRRARNAGRSVLVRIPAIWTGMTGVLSIAALLWRSPHHQFRGLDRYAFYLPAHLVWSSTLTFGFLLLTLSWGLIRRQKIAWCAAVVISAGVIGLHLGRPSAKDQFITIVAIVNLSLLLFFRSRYRVRTDSPSLRRGAVFAAIAVAFALAYGAAGFWLAIPRDFDKDFGPFEAITHAASGLFLVDSGNLEARTRFARWFLQSLHVVGPTSVMLAVVSLSRPVIWRKKTDARERTKAVDIIRRFGDSSQDEFKAWPDKRYFFGSPGDSVVAYGFAASTAVVLGDPSASDDDAMRTVIRAFADECDRNGWRLAFHQATEQHLAMYQLPGLVTMKIGEEAIVDIPAFSLIGKKMKGLRSARNRLIKEGYIVTSHEPPLDDVLLAKLKEVSDAWLEIDGRRERGFTLGSFDEAYLRRCPVLAMQDAKGEIFAFVNLIPSGYPGETTFDLMRHIGTAPNGSMDFVFLEMIEYARQCEYSRLSLGMVPWSEVGTGSDSPRRERAVRLLSRYFERFFASEGLRAYKDKFQPFWEPRYLIYSGDASLPFISLAIVRLTESPRLDTPLKDHLWDEEVAP